MSVETRVLGINRTQDASICLIEQSSSICSVQKERLTRQKHHWGRRGDLHEWYSNRLPSIREPLDLIVECYSSDPEIKNLDEYQSELDRVLRFRQQPQKVRISHHLAHLYSTFHVSPFDEAAVMIIDCAGSPVRDFTESWKGLNGASPDWVEVSSFYYCKGDEIVCLSKQLWDADWMRPVGLGCFYFFLTRMLFEGEGNEGKVMGLAPFGNPEALGLPPLVVEGEKVFIPDEWMKLFRAPEAFRFFKDGTGSFEICANLAAAGQKCFEDALLAVSAWLSERTGAKALCFAGGTALNCVANGRLLRESPFEDVFVPPSPHDGGTALGCAIYGMVEHLGVKRQFRWVNDFLGPEPSVEAIERAVGETEGLIVERPDNLIERMVDLIISGRVISLYQGRSELGPRALGHRSILADPRSPFIKGWINQHVKGREWFRPLAPAAILEAAPKFFEVDRPVPFMQFAVRVREQYHSVIPAVTHVDGTARLQTVSRDEDPFFYQLIKAFEERTGIGVLLNTSFNRRSEPIVETPVEAIECFKATPMHALAMPPFLLRKETEPALPTAP